MLTTINLKINNQVLEFVLNKGDILWKKVEYFCIENNLQRHQDQIFNLIYNEFQKAEKEAKPQSLFKALTPSKQILQQQDRKDKIHKQQENRSISPSAKILTPKKTSHLKQQASQFVHFQKNQSGYQHLREDLQTEHAPNSIEYQKENCYLREIQQQQQDKVDNTLITNIAKFDNLIKAVYKQIENIQIDSTIQPICIQLYNRLLSTQEKRKSLKLNMINYNLLEDKEIYVLEQIVQKYSLSLAIEMSKTQFVILMIGLIVSGEDQKKKNGVKVRELINFNPSLTPHYQLYC
ncbi:unnamed protein product (macronuclear) [Paramecium tetraurelia]|uniref:Uncharacterized protein n=1 Tax=Paramecium tetraurelia TaxID=5888 RepID=A0E7Z8_PARTE|nr:uncharacterized protein GSPATT00024143001 [Paramecium tetraurelia]CAK91415.1 unnamed protein product [Paramecium tetraurelia]|eukprot:XP_001458812.1 hypothetical protein (macronuclear) [Paramecium tetraurelia strain d4-2]